MKECIAAFESLHQNLLPSPNFPSSLAIPPTATSSSIKRKSVPDNLEISTGPAQKRRQSGTDLAPARIIQPKPASNGSPRPFPSPLSGALPKKRGRPSKADVEARHAEAIARGEVIPTARTLGPRNPQMMGVGQFDARGPVRDLAPSPRILAPSLPIGGDMNVASYSTQPTGNVTTFAPMITGPSSSGIRSPQDTSAPEMSIASAKKKRGRPNSRQIKVEVLPIPKEEG